ncbi:MAG: ATP-binding cassette domain-containing protein [Aeromicrobium sp.]|uniref:ATP-binding cassette domain-containing protein n=1 Tax=Aeromicrobium sp. TaxID=1871063 RepID=UPI0039E25D61
MLALVALATVGVGLAIGPSLGDGLLTGPFAAVVLLAPLAVADALDPVADAERRRPAVEAAEARLAALLASPPAVAPGAGTLPDDVDPTLSLTEVAVVGWDHDLVVGLTAQIAPGEVVGVSGPSGGGKSTLGLTLTAFVAPRDGQIRLGGVDLTTLDPAEARRVVGLLTQDDAVFDTTVRENLRIARPDATDEELDAVMARVGLSLDLDRMVGEQGDWLSGGERQRLALARLLLGRHRVLILDEPTEHLDAPLAEALMDDVMTLAPTHTLILISHDPRVLARCERVLTLG